MRNLFDGQLPQLVMFDLDGTLVDSVPDLAVAVDRMLQALDRPVAGEQKVRQWVGNGAAVLVQRALSGAIKVEPQLDAALTKRALALFMSFYAEATAEHSVLYPGVRSCLDQLQQAGVALGLVTNKPICFTTPLLAQLGLSSYFAVVLGGDSVAVKKPDPQMLFACLQAAEVAPEMSLMVGDSKNDVLAARAAGCPVACVSYGYNHGESIVASSPDLLVDSLMELC
ncbi:phosphoglycolate phosphatase [Pontibacter sp. JAM-7]|uniref:phosphoglycolate phosphatase n=1 Tax=Pontibacter sp. JAM-7 TaxID=3366581 RepID=UPI003AF962A2